MCEWNPPKLGREAVEQNRCQPSPWKESFLEHRTLWEGCVVILGQSESIPEQRSSKYRSLRMKGNLLGATWTKRKLLVSRVLISLSSNQGSF